MGAYHTFFAATDREIERLFPGWKRPKPEPEPRGLVETAAAAWYGFSHMRNWQPVEPPQKLGTPSLRDPVWGPPIDPVVRPAGDYDQMLEEACPPGLRALPHFRSKNVDPLIDFGLFAQLLGASRAPPARIGPMAEPCPVVFRLPGLCTAKLARLRGPDTKELARNLVVKGDLTGEVDTSPQAIDDFRDRIVHPLTLLAQQAVRRGADLCQYYTMHH